MSTPEHKNDKVESVHKITSNLLVKLQNLPAADENPISFEKEEEEVVPDNLEQNVSIPPEDNKNVYIPSLTKPKSAQDEYYRKPFEYGWKRELVYRANMETSKDKADVYFITPTGKKLRTRNDIVPLLEGDLTLEHFSFAKEPLGAGSDFEIVRSAKPTIRSSLTTSSYSPQTDANPNTVSGKRISKPKVPKGASPPPQGWTPTRALKNPSSLLNSNTNRTSTSGGNNVPVLITSPNVKSTKSSRSKK